MEQRLDYTNVLFQDAQDPWEDFQSLLHTENSPYTVTDPDPPALSAPHNMTEVDEEKYQQAEEYLEQRQIHRPSVIMKKPPARCLHPTIHPLHDCRHKQNLSFCFKHYQSLL